MNSKNDSKLTVINNYTKNKNKSKLSKQLEEEQNHRNGDHMKVYQQGSGRGRDGGKVQRISSTNGRQKIVGGGKNSIGNVEAKEVICMTHGHELQGGWSGWS